MSKLERNAPCPCGSGRKAKRCHPDGWPVVNAGGVADSLPTTIHDAADQARTAIHEAGHALACVVLGRRFAEVSLTTEEYRDSSGRLSGYSTLGVQFDNAWNEQSLTHYKAGRLDAKDLLIALAGGAAEELCFGGGRATVEEAMMHDIQNIGYAICSGLEAAGDRDADRRLVDAILSAAWERAGVFVKTHRAVIELVGAELRANGSLTFDQVQRFCAERHARKQETVSGPTP